MLYLKKKNLLKCVNNFKDFILTSIRYKHVKLCINHYKSNHLKKFNILAYILGCISCLGISIVGNFQKNKTDIHFAGAFIAFFGLGPRKCANTTLRCFYLNLIRLQVFLKLNNYLKHRFYAKKRSATKSLKI